LLVANRIKEKEKMIINLSAQGILEKAYLFFRSDKLFKENTVTNHQTFKATTFFNTEKEECLRAEGQMQLSAIAYKHCSLFVKYTLKTIATSFQLLPLQGSCWFCEFYKKERI
jgi:hypothetical protein